jgi:hypothetical protein
MKAAKTWCLAGLMMMAGISSASCGKDEGTGDGPGTVIGGSAGSAGSAGNPGRAGGGTGGGGATSATKLGQACVNDSQCVDPAAPGLTCITATDTKLGNGAPPKGLCTAACTPNTDDCSQYGAGSLCYPFGNDTDSGYCVEGCSFGAPDLGEAKKCHSRPEFACDPALFAETNAACTDSTDCDDDELCFDGVCNVAFTACLPNCRGDIDCQKGMYCDQSFLNGVCVPDEPAGKALGEPCTLPGPNEPSEPDECLGFCQADDETGVKGHCATTCGLGNECAWNADSQKFDGACLYLSVLSRNGTTGDFGFCALTCNCTDECNDPALECSLLDNAPLRDEFRGPGVCFSVDPMTTPYNQCTDTSAGGGGAGGESSGGAGAGAGAGGALGDAGAPAGGAGAGAGGAP